MNKYTLFSSPVKNRSIKICPGTTQCKRAVQDSIGLGLKIDERYHAYPLPIKMKMGVSGCMLSCAEVSVKDIGIMGTNKGWKIFVGGNAGPRPRLADLLTEVPANDDAVLAVMEKILDWYKNCGREVRIGTILEEMGIEAFRGQVLGDGVAEAV